MRRTPALIIGLLTGAVSAFAVEDTETIRQSFGTPAQLEVQNFNGAIRVTAAVRRISSWSATKRLQADDQTALAQARSEVRLDIQESGGRLRICVIHPWEDCQENGDRRRRVTGAAATTKRDST